MVPARMRFWGSTLNRRAASCDPPTRARATLRATPLFQVRWSILVWFVVATECCVPCLTLLMDLWINNFNYTISVLRWLEIALAIGTVYFIGFTPANAHDTIEGPIPVHWIYLGFRAGAMALHNVAIGRSAVEAQHRAKSLGGGVVCGVGLWAHRPTVR